MAAFFKIFFGSIKKNLKSMDTTLISSIFDYFTCEPLLTPTSRGARDVFLPEHTSRVSIFIAATLTTVIIFNTDISNLQSFLCDPFPQGSYSLISVHFCISFLKSCMYQVWLKLLTTFPSFMPEYTYIHIFWSIEIIWSQNIDNWSNWVQTPDLPNLLINICLFIWWILFIY